MSFDVRHVVICIYDDKFVVRNHSLAFTMDNLVINISNIVLTPGEISMLSKGLTLCPTPGEPRSGDLRCDLDSLHRKLRLQSYFKDEEDSFPPAGGNFYSLDEFKHHKFRVASTFNPPNPPALESMNVLNEHDFNNRDMFTITGHNNLAVRECKALKELQNMSNIMIKSADKGGAIIVQSREQYFQGALRQLTYTKF